MSKLVAALKAEITRLARREARVHAAPLRAQVRSLKQAAKATKLKMRELERMLARRSAPVAAAAASDAGADASDGQRLGPRSIRAQRTRLGLSQAEMAKLTGVTPVTIYLWESGRRRPRGANRDSLIGLRAMGRRDVKQRLADLSSKGKKPAPKGGGRRRRAKAA